MSSSHAMQSSLRDVLGWVWQTVMSWLASITSRFDDHLCLERPTPEMVVKAAAAADPEMAVENDTKVLVEGEGGARVEKTIDAVLYIEEDAKADQMTADGHNIEVVEDNLMSRDSEERVQTAEHELVSSGDHNGSLNGTTGAEGGDHSDPVVNGASAAADSADKENAPAEGEASEGSNEDIDDIFPFAESIFESEPAPREPKNRRGPSDSNNKVTRKKDAQNHHYVNEDDPMEEGEAGKEAEQEKGDTSVTWMVKVGLTKESYERALYPQYYVLEFRSGIALEKEMVETALKQLRSLLPWLGLGLKRQKKEMWLCLHPEGNINFKMTYGDSSLWDVIANSCDEFAYMEDKLLHPFILMNAQPCSQCRAFVDASASVNSEPLCESSERSPTGLFSSTSGELSSTESSNCCHARGISTTADEGDATVECSTAESSNCCHAPGITTAVEGGTTGECSPAQSNCCQAPSISTTVESDTAGEPTSTESSACCHAPSSSTSTVDDTCRGKNSERDEIRSSATGSDCKCPSPTSVSSSPVDSADKVPLPVSDMSPSVIGGKPPSQEASETVSFENAPVQESQKPTLVTNSVKDKSFPHNYRLVFGIPQSLASEKSFSEICDGFIIKLSTLISESANPGHKTSASIDSTGDVSEHSGEECDGRSPAESVQKTENESAAGEDSGETLSQSNAPSDSDVRRVDSISEEMANVLLQFSVVEDLVTDENSESNATSGESVVPNNDASKIDKNSPHVDRTFQADCSKNFMNKCKSERISFISGFTSCLNAAISQTLVKSGFWKEEDLLEKEYLNISYIISHYYNMEDLYDHEWRDRPDEENGNDDYDGDNEGLVYSVCCRKPTVSLRGNLRTGLKGTWQSARIVDQKRKAAELLQSRNTLPQIIPLSLENLTVSDSQFPSIFQPECNISITCVTDSPRARLDRRLENVELLSCHPIHPVIFFFMTTCITLRVQEGLLTFSFYHRQQLLPNSAAHELADEVESAVVSSVKGS